MCSPFAHRLHELKDLLLGSHVPREAIKSALRLIECPSKIVRIVPQVGSAPPATESSISLEPSDFLDGLVAAARAGDWDRFIVLEHGATPSTARQGATQESHGTGGASV